MAITDEHYRLTGDGIETYQQIVDFFEKEYSVENIANYVFPEEELEDAVGMIRMLVIIGEQTVE